MRKKLDREINVSEVSFWHIFRLVFVIFFLYLTGDAFYRWDGFSYYGSFWEFLPSVALVSVLVSALAVMTAVIAWLSLRVVIYICRISGFKITFEHLLLFSSIVMVMGALAWKVKKSFWPYALTTLQMKLAVFVCVALVALVLARLFHRKAEQWGEIVHDRITPLVWLFCTVVMLSVPLVSYHAWFKNTGWTTSKVAATTAVKDQNSPNIILVTFDALAAKDMSAYGYMKDTTPFINKLAQKAAIFKRVESASNFTTPAIASLMTGKRVWTHQTFHIEGPNPVNSSVESLPALLKKYGYYNMAFISNPHASVEVLGIADSFDVAPPASDFSKSKPTTLVSSQFGVLDTFLYKMFGNKIKKYNWILENDFILKKLLRLLSRDYSMTTVPPEKVFNRFLQVLDDNPPGPFFAWLHVFPPHDPYLPPAPYKYFFSNSSEFRTYKSQEDVKLESYKHLFNYSPFPEEMQPAVELIRNYYDEFLKYSDKQFEVFIDELHKRKIKNTVIILSADHGESFEHGYFTHGGPFLYEQVTHVPLIVFDDSLLPQINAPIMNAPTYMKLPEIYPGIDLAVHPDVVYFPNGWNGFKYWMAFTPMPSKYEFPSIVVSQDGSKWIEPQGIINPIDSTPIKDRGYLPDTDLVYNAATDELWVYYLGFSPTDNYLLRKKTSDGINWTSKESLLSVPKTPTENFLISPSVVKINSTYHLWYVVQDHVGNTNRIEHRTSPDGSHWSAAQKVAFPSNYNLWHLDVIYVPGKEEYWMIGPARPSGSIIGYEVLLFAKSTDGINWMVYDTKPTMTKSVSGWDSTFLYRASMVYYPDTDMLRIWYSGGNLTNEYNFRIGHVETDYSEFIDILQKQQKLGLTTGSIINDLVEQIDIPATILELTSIPVPSWMEGRSLMPLMHGGTLPPKPAFSMNFEENRSRGHEIGKGSIAVWDGDYKLIHYLNKEKSLLFNLRQDPDEMQDLSDKEPEKGRPLLRLIQDNLKKANETIRRGRQD